MQRRGTLLGLVGLAMLGGCKLLTPEVIGRIISTVDEVADWVGRIESFVSGLGPLPAGVDAALGDVRKAIKLTQDAAHAMGGDQRAAFRTVLEAYDRLLRLTNELGVQPRSEKGALSAQPGVLLVPPSAEFVLPEVS